MQVFKKSLLTLLASVLLFSLFPSVIAEEPTSEEWYGAHWIWSSAESDRCETALWVEPNGYDSLLIPASEPMDSLIVQTMHPQKLMSYSVPLASEFDVWMNFRRDFTLAEKPEKAEIRIACDSKYYLWVNGEIVIRDGQLRRGPTAEDTYYEIVDLSDHLKAGENSLCVQVWYWRAGGFNNNASGSGGLLLSTGLTDTGTGSLVETGDGLWYALRDPAYNKGTTFNYRAEAGTDYDAQKAIDWTDPSYTPASSGDGWNLASPIGLDESDPGKIGDAPWNELFIREIPQMYHGEIMLSDYAVENGTYTVSLPYNAQFTPYLKLGASTEAGKTIKITTDTTDKAGNFDTYTTKAGAQEYEARNWRNGDRLYFEIPEGIEIEALGYRETGYPIESGGSTPFLGYFDSVISENDRSLSSFTGGHTWTESEADADNNFYDELWNKAARTLYVTVRDTYMDCPDRERSQYIGDAVNEMEEGYYAIGSSLNALNVKALRNIADWQFAKKIGGRTYYLMSNVRPGNNAQELASQSLGTAYAAATYVLYTGDTSLAAKVYPAFYRYLTNYDLETEGDYAGTIAPRPSATKMYESIYWFDWGSNQDIRPETTLWWYLSAKAVKQLAETEDSGATAEEIAWIEERMHSIEDSFESFWNDELKAYATPWSKEDWSYPSEKAGGLHLVDDRVNALAIVSGLAPESRYADLRNVFMGTETSYAYENASIYMEKYVIEALYRMGYDTDAMSRMRKRHIDDVNNPDSSTLPEYWNMGGTKNHGWSGGSMIALSRYAAGIEPTENGYLSWHVIPQLGSFVSIKTRVPSAIGLIDLSIETDERQNATSMTVTSPGGSAEVWLPVAADQTPAQISGAQAEYLGIREAYQKQYAVYAISEAGTYAFEAKGEQQAAESPGTEAPASEAASSVASSPAASGAQASGGSSVLPWILGGAAALIAAIAIVLLMKRKKNG